MICEPVPAGLTPNKLESGNVGVRPHIHKGIPALAGYKGPDRYGVRREFPEARPAFWEAPETLRPKLVFTSGETEVRGMWVFSPGETPDARNVRVFPWARLSRAEDGCSLDERY